MRHRDSHRNHHLRLVALLSNPTDGPIIVGTDSLPNGQVARRQGAPARVKHTLRLWETFTRRMREGMVRLVHVPDAEMPTDFLTKWVPKQKVKASIAYLTNIWNRIRHPRDSRE